MKKAQRIILLIARLLFGVTFLFSGFVKAVDPLGTAYKVSDYFEAFGIPSFDELSIALAFILITVEFCIGFAITCNVKLKMMSRLGALFMLVMTPLTLYLALANPVSDCGCFGDAIVLTNWETFYKNVALCVLLVVIMVLEKYNRPWLSEWGSWLFLACFSLLSLGMCTYGYTHLPVIDFRPYKVGNNIQEGMMVPADAPMDEYKTTFVYAKDGIEKEFTLENYPADDSTWVFVSQQSVLVKKGYVPPIHDFSIVMEEMGDITDVVLEKTGYTLLVISHKLEKINLASVQQVQDIVNAVAKKGVSCYWLTSSYIDEVNRFKQAYSIQLPFGATDDITLKTIIRSNPGLVLLNQGTVVAKWHHNALPAISEIYQLIN
jgi:uncharacterized membrane protein YphA (DoxX/SURF4 family)